MQLRVGDGEPAGRVRRRPAAEQLVQRRRLGQRRQPHLVGRRALPGEPGDQHVEQADPAVGDRGGHGGGRRRRCRGDRMRGVRQHQCAARRRRPASATRRGTGPETYAAWNRTSGSVPALAGSRGRARGAARRRRARRAPPATPARENVRSPIRYDRWVSRPRSRPSSRRWEASSRCTPSDRPSRPIWTNRSMKSGLADSSSENSSQTTSSDGSGASGGAGRPGLLVVAQRGEVAGPAQQLLPADQLAVDRVDHAVDQRQLVGEVGDHRGGVRQPVQRRERRAALEVDQHEVERLGRVRRGEPEHQRAQQLRLAGAGRADQQAVRAHAVLAPTP